MNGGTSPDLRIDLTSPIFNEIKIKLNSSYYQGKEFVIKAHNNSVQNIYIQSAKLNGVLLKENYISFKDIVNGGLLELNMASKPN
ncbi:glycoside hydrolase domain-containing protein [Pedobacter steynii]